MTEFSSHWFKCEADRFGCTFAQLVYSTPRLDKRLTGMGGGHAQLGTQNQEMISFWPTTHIRSVCQGCCCVSVLWQKCAQSSSETQLSPISSHPGGQPSVQWSGTFRSPLSLMPVKVVVL